MEIKIDDLWQYSGISVTINDKLANDFLPKGSYVLVGKEKDGLYRLFDGIVFYLLEEWVDDDIITTYSVDVGKRVNNLVEAHTALCINLIQDGWRADSDHFNLTPYLDELRGYKTLQSILKTTE